jgi:predicted Zn finger-like uncharacterized protein
MALATRCPNCQALFRVGAEQLRSRGGMVRCGSCRRVFNAISGLDYLDAQRLEAGTTERPAAASAPSPADGAPGPVAAALAKAPPPAAVVPPPSPKSPEKPAAPDRNPAVKATPARAGQSSWVDLAAFSLAQANPRRVAAGQAEAETDPRPGPATLFAISKPQVEAGDAHDDSSSEDPSGEPSFLRAGADTPGRPARVAMAVAIVILAAALVTQLALILRSPLILALPALRPALQTLCAPLGCTASWPMRPDLLAVVSSALESVPGTDALEFDAVLRNRADFALALPAIELTISDDIGHAVARKVFLPADYLAAAPDGHGEARAVNIGAGADLALRIRFEFAGGAAAGFEAYPFYP